MSSDAIVFAVLTAIMAAGSLTTAVFAIIISFRTASSQMEMSLRQQINDAEKYKDDRIIELVKEQNNTKVNDEFIKVLEKTVDSALQRLVNVYDDACGLYIDRKVSRKRFRKNFEAEIINNVNFERYHEYYHGKEKVYYQKTLKVYEEWTKKE